MAMVETTQARCTERLHLQAWVDVGISRSVCRSGTIGIFLREFGQNFNGKEAKVLTFIIQATQKFLKDIYIASNCTDLVERLVPRHLGKLVVILLRVLYVLHEWAILRIPVLSKMNLRYLPGRIAHKESSDLLCFTLHRCSISIHSLCFKANVDLCLL